MKFTFFKITLIAFIAVGAISCKNSEKEATANMEEAAEATEMAT